ncbi:[LysW]-aminoadipate/[LysW]-glutamate kinase [Candidatus Anstonella stagnisolia]|nr:[LysW]-aminoadipate/[LysW]-glutamate kinase [Candidatus Anstonella stagnisolia]
MQEKPILIIKVGGSIASTPDLIAQDLASLHSRYSIVVVHGCSAQMNELYDKFGIKPAFITSPTGFKSRYTNADTIRVYNLAIHNASTSIILALQKVGVNAVGLSGFDGKAVVGKQKIVTSVDETGKQKLIRDDFTGKIEKINGELLKTLLNAGYTPVVGALAMGEPAQPLNIDGDRLAAAVGAELHANIMISLTDVDGYYRNFPNDLVATLNREELKTAIENAGGGKASGGMKKKLFACAEALDGGVHEVIIGNGTVPSPISRLLEGKGTHCKK